MCERMRERERKKGGNGVEFFFPEFYEQLKGKKIKFIWTCLLFLSRPLFDDVTEFIERDLRLLSKNTSE